MLFNFFSIIVHKYYMTGNLNVKDPYLPVCHAHFRAPQFIAEIQRMLIDVLITHRCVPCQRPSLNPQVSYKDVLTGVNSSTFRTGASPRWNLKSKHTSSIIMVLSNGQASLCVSAYIWNLAWWTRQVSLWLRSCSRHSRDPKPTAGEEVNCWNYDCDEVQYLLFTSGCTGRLEVGRRVWWETQSGGRFVETHKAYLLDHRFREQWSGGGGLCAVLVLRLPTETWSDGQLQGCRLTICGSKCSHAVISH